MVMDLRAYDGPQKRAGPPYLSPNVVGGYFILMDLMDLPPYVGVLRRARRIRGGRCAYAPAASASRSRFPKIVVTI